MNGYVWAIIGIELAQAAGFFALLGFVYLRSPGWTGMNHDARLRIVEDRSQRALDTIDNMAGNQHRAYDEINRSIGSVLLEVQKVQRQLVLLQPLPHRVEALETKHADLEQRVVAIAEMGCGFPDCPRLKVNA